MFYEIYCNRYGFYIHSGIRLFRKTVHDMITIDPSDLLKIAAGAFFGILLVIAIARAMSFGGGMPVQQSAMQFPQPMHGGYPYRTGLFGGQQLLLILIAGVTAFLALKMQETEPKGTPPARNEAAVDVGDKPGPAANMSDLYEPLLKTRKNKADDVPEFDTDGPYAIQTALFDTEAKAEAACRALSTFGLRNFIGKKGAHFAACAGPFKVKKDLLLVKKEHHLRGHVFSLKGVNMN
jgi:hypothetical protein